MKKEIIIAILLGMIVGLVITYGIYSANQAIQKNKLIEQQSSTLPNPTNLTSELNFAILEPEDYRLFDTDSATISGQTEPNTVIAVIAENGENLVQADEDGLFTTNISLVSGVNIIKIIAVNKTGQQIEKILNLVYSTASI